MKKRIALLLATVLAVGTLATACGGNEGGNDAKVKVGLGVHVDMTYGSADATAEKAGATQADLHVAAVTVDADGKVVDVIVDSIQIKATFDTTGAVVAGTEQTFQTKRELGDDYAMEAIMGDACIGEWYFQADNFETWCKGKTADQIEAALGSDGYPANDELKTGCTIKVNGLVPAVVRAIKDATTEVAATDTLGLGLVGETAKAAFDTEKATGSSQAYANFVATTTDKDGKITACILDSVQANFTWDATGKITSDLNAEPTTKYDLKEKYGMKDVSKSNGVIPEGGEWYEQADKFMQYVIGMTADQVAAIAVDEGGYVADETLKSGCTMKITAYQAAVAKALAK
ncbi:MAG: hypothetical protein IJ455_02955 [Agathobacter sp.]|nr:hypothetical protein [Agathobacter sp.]